MGNKNVVFIGAGNVATHLSKAMKEAGLCIRQIYSRGEDNAKKLAGVLDCSYTTDIQKVLQNADIYVFSIKDDAFPEIIANMPTRRGFWIHTAGSVSIDIFQKYADSYGVIYPMQTLSKSRKMNFSKIPLFVEGNTSDVENEIFNIASTLSDNVTRISSEKRKYLHLAAVFACNFSNHMYTLASLILDKQEIDWHILQPLIDETAGKLYSMSPQNAQTGPAIRYDRNIIDRHLTMIDDEDMRKLYEMISESIAKAELLSENTD